MNNLLNPKGTLFYLGVFTTIVTPETSTAGMLLLVVIMMSISASFWIGFLYALDRRTLRRVLERSQQKVKRALGGLLILLGVRLALASR